MPTITVDPATGRLMLDGQLLDRNDPRLWGGVGREIVSPFANNSRDPNDFDSRYYEPFTAYDGDNGEITNYRLRPEVEQRLGGRVQLSQSGIGGYSEVLDPSQLEWDDEFGILTKPENIGAPDDGSFLDQYGVLLPALIAGGGIALELGGLLGGGGAAAGGGAGAGAGSLSLPGLMAPVDLGGLSVGSMASSTIPGLGGAAGAIGAGSGTPLMLAPGMENAAMIDSWLINNGMAGLAGGNITAGLGGLLGDSGALGSIGSNVLGAAVSNPLAALGLIGGIGDAIGGGGSPSGGGWSGDSTPLNIGSSNYTPNAQTQRQLDDLYGGKMNQANNGLKGGQMPTNTGINPAYGMTGGGSPFNPPTQNPYGNPYTAQTGGPSPMEQKFPTLNPYANPYTAQTGGPHPLETPTQVPTPWTAPTGGPHPLETPTQVPPPVTGGPSMPQGSLGQQSGYGLRPGTTWVSPNGMYARDANGQQYMTANQQYQQQSATPQWNGSSYSGPLDISWRNIAKGDQYTGERNGFLWAAGNRIKPSSGNLESDRMELARQFGVGGPSANTNPLLQGRMPARWSGGLLGG